MENPAVLFDKSVFQETPISAFVAADRYLEIIVPPILVREIGGDLATTNAKRREQDQRVFVAKLARRAGNRAFVSHHASILHDDLIGCPVPMDGRTPIMMRPVPNPNGRAGLSAVETPEEYALNRWRQGDFSTLDHLWAHNWQRVQKIVRANFYSRSLKKVGLEINRAKSLEQLDDAVREVMCTPAAQAKLLFILFSDFNVPERYQVLAIKRFQSKKPRQLLSDFAPYASFCLKANLLLGFAGELLKRPHPHDLRDLEYLYYLPFCEVFASEDKLHRKLAPMLARPNQMIVGRELGKDLECLADAWNQLSPEEKIEFARVNRNTPPKYEDSLVRMIWERYRSPEVALDEMIDPRPDEFFNKLLIQWGEEHLRDTVENPSFILYRDELIRQRAEELYPGVNFDEQ